jgi:cell division protease FtsH
MKNLNKNNKNNQNNNNNPNNNFFNQNPLLTFGLFSLVVIILFKTIVGDSQGTSEMQNKATQTKDVTYSEVKEMIKNGAVQHVAIGDHTIKALSEQGNTRILYVAKTIKNDSTLIPLLEEKKISYGGFSETNWFSDMLFGWLIPIFIFFAIWLFLASRMQKSMGGGMLGMNKGDGIINSEKPQVKFDDVAGAKEAKEEVSEIVEFLRYPERYIELGAKIPKGVLLVGPPGTGKTLLAKAVAGEADVPFFSMSGSSFIEMFVGVGASRVRDLFEKAKKDAPAIIFIDEIDAIGKSRNAGGPMGGNDEREQTLNQLLAEMDGFSTNVPIIVLAATNRPEVLDPALLRPGRFDRQVLVDKPDFEGRKEILNVHIKGIKLAPDVDLDELARMTAGLAGADLANIINEAALLAGRKSKKQVEQKDFFEAVERAIAGLEKKSRRINPKEKKIVAYHESGHALLAETTKGAKRVSKVSIVPRGLAALGYTLNKPEENRFLMQKHELIAEVDVLLGGRAAEEVFLGEISTGASNDLERATDIIKSMVSLYGMSDVAGLMVLRKQQNMFLGGGLSSAEYSDKTAQELDNYIKTMLDERYKHVKSRLKEYDDAIEKMVEKLFEKETIEGEEVTQIIKEYEDANGLESKIVNHDKDNDLKQVKKDDEGKDGDSQNEDDSNKDK